MDSVYVIDLLWLLRYYYITVINLISCTVIYGDTGHTDPQNHRQNRVSEHVKYALAPYLKFRIFANHRYGGSTKEMNAAP